jgi:hypothetical protein
MEQSGRCHLDHGVMLVALDPLRPEGTDERTEAAPRVPLRPRRLQGKAYSKVVLAHRLFRPSRGHGPAFPPPSSGHPPSTAMARD